MEFGSSNTLQKHISRWNYKILFSLVRGGNFNLGRRIYYFEAKIIFHASSKTDSKIEKNLHMSLHLYLTDY